MTRVRRGRDRRRVDRSLKPINNSQFSGLPPLAGTPVSGGSVPQSVPPASLEPDGRTVADSVIGSASSRLRVPIESLEKLLHSWKFWVGSSAVVFVTSGAIATALLLRLPAVPNCPAIFWPMASASLRMYCAQLAANKDTVDDLLSAIQLVNELPKDHPLRPEINRNIEEWSEQLLQLCDQTFNAGKLEEAIGMARKIPANVPVYSLVEERINNWQSIWSKAEEIYNKAEAELRKQNWPQAFREAVQLLDIENQYWATVKYEEITNIMKVAREDGSKLGKAYSLADQGGLEKLLEAIKVAQSIEKNSRVYEKSREAIKEFSQKMMDLAEESLEKRDLSAAVEIARQIPEEAKLKEEVADFIELARAQSLTWQDSVSGLESAIAAAQKIAPNRPLYSKAKRLITEWQDSIQNLGYLEKARSLARTGSVNDLKAAISQAEQIDRSKPRWEEAQSEIDRWRGEIETQEDRPYLERAEMLARSGDVNSLQAAINQAGIIGRNRALYGAAQEKIDQWSRQIQEQQDRPILDIANQLARGGRPESLDAAISQARKIGSGRALYEEAQAKIDEWNRQIQEQQDRPIMDNARQLAAMGQYSDAINRAERIISGRALYGEAQDAIQAWKGELRGRQNLEDAYRYAGMGTPETLASAIRAANQVSDSSRLRSEADSMINQWSDQILSLAQQQASYDPQGAIEIARKIPSYAGTYSAAQVQITLWQRQIAPAPIPEPAPQSTPTTPR
ncbi:chromosome segregation ATPase [Ancylothrix sp. C2]|uniref:chromosome segregation ATPase n=1 Tax=Ancylothrix sp. D3o TaxID=2953691 RepID=UPI0021BA6B91|nr:chromosome segregation ATPase [Ancylothrix sp. D3o]MCT7952014.1 chromosome segregation ATPase [Ancylothrix sp. D3o]